MSIAKQKVKGKLGARGGHDPDTRHLRAPTKKVPSTAQVCILQAPLHFPSHPKQQALTLTWPTCVHLHEYTTVSRSRSQCPPNAKRFVRSHVSAKTRLGGTSRGVLQRFIQTQSRNRGCGAPVKMLYTSLARWCTCGRRIPHGFKTVRN
jgi:hypothetical protein